jgi:hypothetical protein
MAAIEILVSDHSKAKIMREIGSLEAARFATVPSHRSAVQRLLVGWLPDLDSTKSFRELTALWGAASKVSSGVPFILLSPGSGETVSSVALFQNLIHWSRDAGAEPYVAPTREVLRRMIAARQKGAEEALIASASIEDGRLVVWSCEPRRFEVAVAEVPVLARMPPGTLAKFELSASGSRIRWPVADVDLNLDTIREYADPALRNRHEAEARKEAARYAQAIRRFREERGLRQTDIDGLTDRQVRRLEEGGTVPHIETLKKLAAAHGLSMNDYLKELAARSRTTSPRKSAPRSGPAAVR